MQMRKWARSEAGGEGGGVGGGGEGEAKLWFQLELFLFAVLKR